jgi:hypothetical protein
VIAYGDGSEEKVRGGNIVATLWQHPEVQAAEKRILVCDSGRTESVPNLRMKCALVLPQAIELRTSYWPLRYIFDERGG